MWFFMVLLLVKLIVTSKVLNLFAQFIGLIALVNHEFHCITDRFSLSPPSLPRPESDKSKYLNAERPTHVPNLSCNF